MSSPPTLSHHIGITLGDPAGIGAEITAALLHRLDDQTRQRIRVFGDALLLARGFDAIGQRGDGCWQIAAGFERPIAPFVASEPNPTSARAQIEYLEAAVAAALRGEIGAIVTAPISKASIASAGFGFPGHTEFLATRCAVPEVAMMFASPRLRVVLVTVHAALRDVPTLIADGRIESAAGLAIRALQRDFAIAAPRVGVLGLNPHAGEDGMFGDEEARIIAPAIARIRAAHPKAEVHGPLSPDAAFRQPFDLFVSMYHDQALIAVKLLDFERSVNVTLGLPIIRTSPDHGVAYALAGTGKADPTPFISAFELARTLLDNRRSRSS